MSSLVISTGMIAGAVALTGAAAIEAVPVATKAGAAILGGAAMGAGWAAWKSGQLLIEGNRAADRVIAEKKKQKEEAKRQRELMAAEGHEQLLNMCRSVLTQLEKEQTKSGEADADLMEIISGVKQICSESLPDDSEKLESMNTLGYIKLENLIRKKRKLNDIQISEASQKKSISVAERMEELRVAFSAAILTDTIGADVKVKEPAVAERMELNHRLINVTGRMMAALEYVNFLEKEYGLSDANMAWFKSCFLGVDQQVKRLCRTTISNNELKKGIRGLEEQMEQFDMLYPSLEADRQKIDTLYSVYTEAAKALGERIKGRRDFQTVRSIENELYILDKRCERADICARIYQKLGASGYLSYAWDQELKALGYPVRSRQAITAMAGLTGQDQPKYEKIGRMDFPFYPWEKEELTQFYEVSEDCTLQMIVNKDGSVSMETLTDSNDVDKITHVQKAHCAKMKILQERLRENWFILFDQTEEASPKQHTSINEWKTSDKNLWKKSYGAELVNDQRAKETENSRQAMQRKC